jgi:hypothetical protein
MQLALTPEVLFPLGACAVAAVAVVAIVVVLMRGRRASTDETSAPTAEDWTGEAATSDPEPMPTVTVPALPRRMTVAEAVAARDADTAPLPVSSVAFLGAGPATSPALSTGPLPLVAPGSADLDPTGLPQAEPPPDLPTTSPAPAAEATGSGPSLAVAVAHALAARAAAGREVAPASRTADARDRLLAVLLVDPAAAIDAAEELINCRGQLDDVLARLASSGLAPDQLARLSGCPLEQVTTLVARQAFPGR